MCGVEGGGERGEGALGLMESGGGRMYVLRVPLCVCGGGGGSRYRQSCGRPLARQTRKPWFRVTALARSGADLLLA